MVSILRVIGSFFFFFCLVISREGPSSIYFLHSKTCAFVLFDKEMFQASY